MTADQSEDVTATEREVERLRGLLQDAIEGLDEGDLRDYLVAGLGEATDDDWLTSTLVASRIATDSGERHDLDSVIKALGFDRAELERELEREADAEAPSHPGRHSQPGHEAGEG